MEPIGGDKFWQRQRCYGRPAAADSLVNVLNGGITTFGKADIDRRKAWRANFGVGCVARTYDGDVVGDTDAAGHQPPGTAELPPQNFSGKHIFQLSGYRTTEKAEVVQICGFFNACFGQSVGLFRDLREPIVEKFEPTGKIDIKLREAMEELVSQEIGKGAMATSLLKQVIITLVRRSLKSSQGWTDRFSILSDRQITRAFADMVARPGAQHTVQSLSHSAG